MNEPEIRKVAAWVPVTAETVADVAASRPVVDEVFDRWMHPWKYPDRNPMPEFVLFPTLARIAAWLKARRDHDQDDDWCDCA